MDSSTYKSRPQCKERPLNAIDDSNFLNLHLDSDDLERATATLDVARSSNRGPQAPYRGPGVFRIHIAPQFQMPNIPRAAIFRSKADSSPECRSQSRLARTVSLRRHATLRSPALSQIGPAEDSCSVDSRSREAALRPQASNVSTAEPLGIPGPRLSDFGRGLVSIRRDFTSSPQRVHPRNQHQ